MQPTTTQQKATNLVLFSFSSLHTQTSTESSSEQRRNIFSSLFHFFPLSDRLAVDEGREYKKKYK